MNIPNDPMILLSFVNTKLRDEYSTLEEFCNHFNIKGVETDILSVIEAYKNISQEEANKPAATRLALSDRHKAVHNVRQLENLRKTISNYLPNPSVNSAILIRAPSRFIS